MELQSSILEVDIFLVWVAAIGLRWVKLWLSICQSSRPRLDKLLLVSLTADAGSMV